MLVRALELESMGRFQSPALPTPAVLSWVGHLTSLSLHCSFWKAGMRPHPPQVLWELPRLKCVRGLSSYKYHHPWGSATTLEKLYNDGATSVNGPLSWVSAQTTMIPAWSARPKSDQLTLSWSTNTWASAVNNCCSATECNGGLSPGRGWNNTPKVRASDTFYFRAMFNRN